MELTSRIWPTVLLLGDSISQRSFNKVGGFGTLLANSLERRSDVLPRGFSGYNTRQWLTIVKELPFRGEVATLWLGANDANDSAEQGVPLVEYEENLKTIVHALQSFHKIKDIIILTPPPYDPSNHLVDEKWTGRSHERTERYSKVCKEAAKTLQLTCLDVHTEFMKEPDWRSLLCDGLHLSEKGAEVLHQHLLPLVKEKLKKYEPKGMKDDDIILPDAHGAGNVYPSEAIIQWIKQHPSRV